MESHPAFDEFVATIARLRAPDGCPWDRAQTHQSIAHNMIEEAYEAVDAIESGDAAHLREELGDVLMQVVLQAQIAADAGEFTIDDVCHDINEKMVRRHPHVFGDAQADSADQVSDLWDQIKMQERKGTASKADSQTGEAAQEGLLDGVPKSFPALMQAQKISRKAAAAGFEWPDEAGVWDKVAEEMEEFKEASSAVSSNEPAGTAGDSALESTLSTTADSESATSHSTALTANPAAATGDSAEAELEFGDVLFSLVNVARWRGIDAENALRASCAKFRRRWSFMEGAAWAQDKDISDLSMDEMEALWQEAKRFEKEERADEQK